MIKNPPSPQYELDIISLEQLVPQKPSVRKIDKTINVEFIRDEAAHLYCQDNDQSTVALVRCSKSCC